MKPGKEKVMIAMGVVGVAIAASFLLTSCKTIPTGVSAVTPFSLDRYLGTWYEIARFDYSFEKHLNNVTATYSLKANGDVKVDNRGYNFRKQKWQRSIGKAKPVAGKNTGKFKVSFFGPFYAGYNVIAIDDNYKYALVSGKSRKYLWILSREKTIPANIKDAYINMANKLGYETGNLIWVEHDKNQLR